MYRRGASFRACAFVGVIVLHFLPGAECDSQPVVRTDKGLVRGTRHSLLSGKVVSEYLGIPFAKPPVGELRFRKPVPNSAWNGVYDATSKPNSCWQPDDAAFGNFQGSTMWNPNTKKSEDCLYLNVWTPHAPGGPSRKYPVMVWIYGGAFYGGSSALDLYDGKYLAAAGQVVVISMNYRLGLLGFLALKGREDAPGNMGLFDQLLALQWVNANVDAFGGDPDSITLFGESAGSVSVSLLLLSPLSARLFHRAILQSGSALADWAIMSEENADLRYREIFSPSKINCDYDGSVGGGSVGGDAFLACLRSKNASEIVENEYFTGDLMQFPFLPTVDYDFLRETPRAAIEGGRFKKCPLLIGSNANEGSFFVAYLPSFATSYNLSDIDFNIGQAAFKEIIQHAFESYPQWPQSLTAFALDAIVFRYTDWLRTEDTSKNREAIDAAVGDYHFVCPVNRWAAAYVRWSQPVYYYRYSHVSSRKHWGKWTGAMHADELHYIFGEPLRPDQAYTDEEKLFSQRIIGMWTNFARTGDPGRPPADGVSPSWYWPRRSSTGYEYFELSPAALRDELGTVGAGPRIEYCAFWEAYLPGLVTATGNIDEVEKDWKMQYNEWKSRYMVDWRDQYQTFLKTNERSCGKAASSRTKQP